MQYTTPPDYKLPRSGYRSRLLSYPMLYIVATIEAILALHYYHGYVYLDDSPTYAFAGDLLLSGSIDSYRTPTYPLIIVFLRWIFADSWQWAMVTIQYAAFFISAHYLRLLGDKYIGRPKVVFWIIALYLLWPNCTMHFCRAVLTEIFAVTATVFITWFLVKSYPGLPSMADVARVLFWLAFIVFLRPACLYLLPVVIGWYACLWYRNRKERHFGQLIVAGAGVVAICAGVFAYKAEVTRLYGISSISRVSGYNNYFPIRQAHLREPELAKEESMRRVLCGMPDTIAVYDFISVSAELDTLVKSSSYAGFESYVNDVIAAHPMEIGKTVWDRTGSTMLRTPVISFPVQRIQFLIPDFSVYFWVSVIVIALFIWEWRKTRRLPMMTLLMMCVTFGVTAVSALGAMNDWNRLSLPGMFAFYLLVGRLFAILRPELMVSRESFPNPSPRLNP